jgi:aryl-alcohol dehydrogenase-like predicted oxidoreductase
VPIQAIAASQGYTLAQGDDILPIPGTKRRTYLEENIAAAELSEEIAYLNDAFKPSVAAGQRYPEGQMKHLGL